jgi:glutamine amidotransferase
MNSRSTGLELNLQYVWSSFCERGGQTDIHADGWGLAYYHQGRHGLRQFHDVEAASTSPLAQFLSAPTSRIRTTNLMAHIRFATTGAVDLANVHPFSREYVLSRNCCSERRAACVFRPTIDPETAAGSSFLPSFTTILPLLYSRMWGLNFAFCHNGHVPLMVETPNHRLGSTTSGVDDDNDKRHYERFYSPIGTTDSEALFCAILNALRARFVRISLSL